MMMLQPLLDGRPAHGYSAEAWRGIFPGQHHRRPAVKSEVLSVEACMSIKRRYEERDPRGRRINSYRSLGKEFAVSETTILRVITASGTFLDVPEPLSEQELAVRAAASAVLLQELLSKPEGQPEEKKNEPSIDSAVPVDRLKRYG